MTDEEAIKIDEWEIKDKKAEVWIIKGKLQIRALGVIHNVELKALEENRKLKEAVERIKDEIEDLSPRYNEDTWTAAWYYCYRKSRLYYRV